MLRPCTQERDINNTPTESYTRGIDLSGSLEGAGGIGGLLARSVGYSSGNWSTHYFYHADGNGNITYLVDGSQAMAATYRYDPFGNTVSSGGSQATANVYRFSSKECNTNSGTYYFLYRFYDPSLQRWLNRDPLLEPGFEILRQTDKGFSRRPSEYFVGPNLYAFVRNGPIGITDVLGLQPAGSLPTPPIQIPPPSFPSGGAVNAGNSGTLGGINWGNFPDCRPSKGPKPCSTPGARRNIKPGGTITRDCPCTGTVTVQCTQYESCDVYSVGTTGGATYSWTSHSDCAPCPEYSL